MLIQDGIPESRVSVVHEGIDLHRAEHARPADIHRELWLPHGAPLVGNVAALVPHKGQRHLLDAAALVLQKVPDARFIIAGTGELEQSLTHHAHALNLDKHVFFTGFRPDVLSLHKAFDIFVMSSVTEGLGTSVLDAMACGRPVVSTRAGGLPEIVDHERTGLLVPLRDPSAMADAIVRLLTDDALRARYGAAGLQRIRERFNADRMVDETVEVYARAVGTPHAAGSANRAGAD